MTRGSCIPISVIRKLHSFWFISLFIYLFIYLSANPLIYLGTLGCFGCLINRTSQPVMLLFYWVPTIQTEVNSLQFLLFPLEKERGETFPGLEKTRIPIKGEKRRVEVAPGGAFSVHQQGFLNFGSGVGHWWPPVTQGHEGEQFKLCLQGAADEENFKAAQVKFLVSPSSLTKRNRGKSLIYFYLEWGNRNLIFWPSHLEIAAELVRGVSGRAILCLFQNRRKGCVAVNNDKIWPVKLSLQW